MSAENGRTAGKWVDGITGEMPFPAALERVFRQRWQTLLDTLPHALDDDFHETEHVHAVRVASRRLIAALDLLAEFFPDLLLTELRDLAQKLRRTCGKARNFDVRKAFLDSLLAELTSKQQPGVKFLRDRVASHRVAAQKILRRQLPKLADELRVAGEELLLRLPAAVPFSPSDDLSFRRTGARVLLRNMDQLWKWPAESVENPRQLHQLRIACKRFRYAVEVFAPVLHEALREEFYPQLQHLQDLLGEIHDDIEADYDLERDRRRWKKRRDKDGVVHLKAGNIDWKSLRRGIDAVRQAYADRAEHAYAEFHDLWPSFAGDAFRIPLEELLAAVSDGGTSAVQIEEGDRLVMLRVGRLDSDEAAGGSIPDAKGSAS